MSVTLEDKREMERASFIRQHPQNTPKKDVSVSCDARMPRGYVIGGPELIVTEVIYNIRAKSRGMIHEIVVGKIEFLNRIHPDYVYDTVNYEKDTTGGLICRFKFKKK